MITASTPVPVTALRVTPDRLQAGVAALADLAATGGRDTAAGLLQGILRELRVGTRTTV